MHAGVQGLPAGVANGVVYPALTLLESSERGDARSFVQLIEESRTTLDDLGDDEALGSLGNVWPTYLSGWVRISSTAGPVAVDGSTKGARKSAGR